MVPSCAGGSSTPFLSAPLVQGRLWRPSGAVPRPVQRTVRRSAHEPSGTRIPVPPPTAPDRKVPTGSERALNRRSPPEHGGAEKKSKEIPQPWQPPVSPASLTSRTARRERGAGPYTFSPGRSPGANGTRRGRATPRRAPGARILLPFPPSHTDCPGSRVRSPCPRTSPAPRGAGPSPVSDHGQGQHRAAPGLVVDLDLGAHGGTHTAVVAGVPTAVVDLQGLLAMQ